MWSLLTFPNGCHWLIVLIIAYTQIFYCKLGCHIYFYLLLYWVMPLYRCKFQLLFTSCAVVFILVNQWLTNGSYGMFDHSQLFGGTWPWAYPTLCFSCGYFAYDQWDMLHYRLYNGWIPAILFHHLILLICFSLALYRNVTINYLILTLICEV